MKLLLGIALTAALVGCSGNDATSACVNFCNHDLNCQNQGQDTQSCGPACVNYTDYYPSAGTCDNYTTLFNCLTAVPCDQLPASTAVTSCYTQAGCH
jgi:hypothetical protein